MSVETALATSQVLIEKRRSKRFTDFIFEEGNKILFLTIDTYFGKAATRIETVNENPKIPGTTTELYKKALEAMKQTATIIQEPIEYSFTSNNPTLKAWVRDPEKGLAIFQWEEISEENGRLTAKKIIHPDNG